MMEKHNSDEQWSVYESNVQAYRSNFLSSQSLLLAVGAITLDKSIVLTVFISIIALIQIWYIWVRTIYVRTQIVDFHKYNMSALFDNEGNLRLDDMERSDYLSETCYVRDNSTRKKVHAALGKVWGRPERFRNLRLTRIKFDVIIPTSITFIWIAFIIYSWVA